MRYFEFSTTEIESLKFLETLKVMGSFGELPIVVEFYEPIPGYDDKIVGATVAYKGKVEGAMHVSLDRYGWRSIDKGGNVKTLRSGTIRLEIGGLESGLTNTKINPTEYFVDQLRSLTKPGLLDLAVTWINAIEEVDKLYSRLKDLVCKKCYPILRGDASLRSLRELTMVALIRFYTWGEKILPFDYGVLVKVEPAGKEVTYLVGSSDFKVIEALLIAEG